MKIKLKWFLTISFLASLHAKAFFFDNEQQHKVWRNELFDKLQMQPASKRGSGYYKKGPTNIFPANTQCEINISSPIQEMNSHFIQVSIHIYLPEKFVVKKLRFDLENSKDDFIKNDIFKEAKVFSSDDYYQLTQIKYDQKNVNFYELQFDENSKIQKITFVNDFGELYNRDTISCEVE